MWESGISGWRADWRPGAEQVTLHASELVSLAGAKLTGAWSIWIGTDDWFADMPVVLEFDGSRRLEVCWQRFDDLSLSWNTIDIDVTPKAWVDDLFWRPMAHAALRMNEGQIVTSVATTDFTLTISDADSPRPGARSTTFTGGLWFETTGPGLHIFNALDANGLETTYEPGLLRRLPTRI